MKPSVGRIVHYVSHGSPDGPQRRAAFVTELTEVEVNEQNPAGDGIYRQTVGLMVANPFGLDFPRGVLFDDGAETAGTPDCPAAASHGNPFRYCACGWIEAYYKGGTWHWPERAE